MNFTSLELSKKLVALGCKSCVEREKYYFIHSEELDSEGDSKFFEAYPKFCLEDFAGTHEQAWENCKKRWGINFIGKTQTKEGISFSGESWLYHRHKMIDSDDWRDYLEKAVEGR